MRIRHQCELGGVGLLRSLSRSHLDQMQRGVDRVEVIRIGWGAVVTHTVEALRVAPRGPPRRRDLVVIDLLVRVTGFDRIDVAVIEGNHPVLDAEALCGTPLYEHIRGAFAEAQLAALAHRRDTSFLRALDVQALKR